MTPPASGRETPLSRDEVIDAALELTRTVGVRGLTMRGLAQALGVSPMATYHYVANKQELVQLVGDAVSSTWPKLEPSDQPWDEALRRHLVLIWETLRRYPGLGMYLLDRPASGITQTTVDRAVEFFCAAGFSPREAILAWALTETYLHGRLSIESRLHGLDNPPGTVDGLRSRDFVEYAVDSLIDGLRARLRASQAAAAATS